MRIGILGKKLGMSQVFTEEGRFVPVTVIEAGPCTVLNVKEGKALLGFGNKKEKNTPRQELGVYKKINASPSAFVKEVKFELDGKAVVGQQVTIDIFKERDFVDITGTSKGKGFQGGVKRWGWAGGPSSHGSMQHRKPGSIGGSSFPSRVWKGQKFAGRMGNEKKTVQNLEVVKVYKEKNLMLVKGAVPGANNDYLEIRTAKKRPEPAAIKVKEEVKKDAKAQGARDKGQKKK